MEVWPGLTETAKSLVSSAARMTWRAGDRVFSSLSDTAKATSRQHVTSV